jgi:hypothetical protein
MAASPALRAPAAGADRVADARVGASAVRGPAHRSPAVGQPQRLRVDRGAGPARAADFEACGANIADLGEEHGHHVLQVRGKGGKTVLVLFPPSAARAIEYAPAGRDNGPILGNTAGRRMDRHAATRRLVYLSETSGIRMPRMHLHLLRHTFVTTMLDAGVSLRDVQIAALARQHPRQQQTAAPSRSAARKCRCACDSSTTAS